MCVTLLFCMGFFIYCVNRYLYPIKYSQDVLEFSKQNNLESSLVFALIKTESNFDKNAKSVKGAKGLMQISDSTAQYIAKNLNITSYDIFSPQTNIKFGCWYLRYLINKFKNMQTAVAAYNAGEGKVANWLKQKEYSSNGITLDNIPFNETKQYVNRILSRRVKYKKLYPKIVDKTLNFE